MHRKDYKDKSGLAYYWIEANMGRVLLVILFAGIGLWGLLLEGKTDLSLIQKLARGMGPELAGIVIAAVTIEALAVRRQEAERKKILISQLGSQYRDVTEIALIELRNREWLYDGSLSRANLQGANLSGTNLGGANLSGTNLGGANLGGAFLEGANLSGAKLERAYLKGVNLHRADLSGANLRRADLNGGNCWEAILCEASLWEANLSGVSFKGANLSGVNLEDANLVRASFLDTNLNGANLSGANLSGAEYWTVKQLEQSVTSGAIMPDGIQLGRKGDLFSKPIKGPTFQDWKTCI